jgi:hypothetical protein
LRQAGLGAGALLGGGALLAFPSSGLASGTQTATNDTQTILNVATSGEVLATIVTTVGFELGLGGDAVTQRTIGAAAREELIHYQVLVASGGMPASKQIWVPDAVFANRTNFLSTIEVGDQIFINAYLIATLTFGNAGNGTLATVAAEFMGVEGVHRALARQALGKLGNDRVFMKLDDPEGAPDSPNRGTPGFCDILTAVSQLQAAGFGFGQQGSLPGKFYDFDAVSAHTPDDPDINQRAPDTCDCECTTHDHSSGHGTNPPTSTPGTSTTTPATTTHTPTASTTPTTTTPTAPHQSDHHHAG